MLPVSRVMCFVLENTKQVLTPQTSPYWREVAWIQSLQYLSEWPQGHLEEVKLFQKGTGYFDIIPICSYVAAVICERNKIYWH